MPWSCKCKAVPLLSLRSFVVYKKGEIYQNLKSQYHRQSHSRSAECNFIETNNTVNSTHIGFCRY